jgi:hypothetical protein
MITINQKTTIKGYTQVKLFLITTIPATGFHSERIPTLETFYTKEKLTENSADL